MPGEIVVTSACESIVAGGILGLGYVLKGTTAGAELDDPTGIFRNIRRAADAVLRYGKAPSARPLALISACGIGGRRAVMAK